MMVVRVQYMTNDRVHYTLYRTESALLSVSRKVVRTSAVCEKETSKTPGPYSQKKHGRKHEVGKRLRRVEATSEIDVIKIQVNYQLAIFSFFFHS